MSTESKHALPTQAFLALCSFCSPVLAQGVPSDVAAQFHDVVGNRVEALNILSGDYGFSGGLYSFSANPDRRADVDLLKAAGGGELGELRPIGDGPFSWQPRVQGAMGYLKAENNFRAGLLKGDESEYRIFATEFGGGVRFWFNDHLSSAPTLSGMYGRTENSYEARSQFATSNYPLLKEAGLIEWQANTWSVIPGTDLQYEYAWHRTIFTLSSAFSYFHTESFDTSSPNLKIRGDSETWRNKVDVDAPLGIRILNHEVRSGGFFSRTELFGDIENGLNADHVYELHGRLVLDFLGQFWKVRWLGVGGSYIWGPSFEGWCVAADMRFKF